MNIYCYFIEKDHEGTNLLKANLIKFDDTYCWRFLDYVEVHENNYDKIELLIKQHKLFPVIRENCFLGLHWAFDEEQYRAALNASQG